MKRSFIDPAGMLFQPIGLRLTGGLNIHIVDGVLIVNQSPVSFLKLQSTWPNITAAAATTTTTLLNCVLCNHMKTHLRRLEIKFTALKLPNFLI
jgi:hypothetical protein